MAALRQRLSGAAIRTVCYLWEQFTQKRRCDLPEFAGPTVEVFAQDQHVTGPPHRDSRWRVAFNGFGSLSYCATLKRTPYLQQVIQSDLLGRTRELMAPLGKGVLKPTLEWAYQRETKDSFAIQREALNEEKARIFMAMLHQAHEARALSEEYLVELQHSVLTNPFDWATGYRTEQNWLRGRGRGADGVTYLPPPEHSRES